FEPSGQARSYPRLYLNLFLNEATLPRRSGPGSTLLLVSAWRTSPSASLPCPSHRSLPARGGRLSFSESSSPLASLAWRFMFGSSTRWWDRLSEGHLDPGHSETSSLLPFRPAEGRRCGDRRFN